MSSFSYDRKTYFDVIRETIFNGSMNQDQVDGQEVLLSEMESGQGGPYSDHWKNSYVMATAYHETAATMQPIEEYGKGSGRPYGQPCSSCGNQKAYGRGYVQLTWCENYQRADDNLNLNGALYDDFSLALDPDIAADIIMQGMHEGWFTGKKLSDYINIDTGKKDYYNARRVVNGTDRADLIKGYAQKFEAALTESLLNIEPSPPEPPELPIPPEPTPPPANSMSEIAEQVKQITGATDVTFNLKFD